MSKKKPKPPDLYLLIRTHPTGYESVYLIHRDGSAHSGLMHGELAVGVADKIAEVTGLRVERDTGKFACQPVKVEGCVTVEEQKTLFS